MFRVVAAALLLGAICGCDKYDSSLLGEVSAPKPSDSTPEPVCGDGRVDEGERCDVAILDGMEGACPTTCPGDDPCYLQVPAGYDCQTLCVGVATTRAINEDGCCPPGVGPGEDSDCGGCGDGIIGPLETCDPPESCSILADCPRGNSCFFKVFVGDPEACTSECHIDLTSSCENDNNCCPAGCTSESDNDCSASCGNQIVEPAAGETCEVGDPDFPCRESCDDGFACTQDLLAGSAENCNVECSNDEITIPINDDGCCPPEAHANIDSDCLPVCGNGVREGEETCDPCDAPCDDGDVCTVDTPSGNPATCSAVCSHTAITQAAGGDGCCPPGENANTDSDCSPDCGNGVVEQQAEECEGGWPCDGCVVHPSLVHRYAFDGTGGTAVDSEGDSDGTIQGASLSGNGSLALTGGSSGPYVDLADDLISSLTNATVEVWLDWNGGNSWQRIFDFGDSSGGSNPSSSSSAKTEWFISPNGTNGLTMVMNFTSTANDTSNDKSISSGTELSQTGKHQVVGVFDDNANTMKLYLDGVLEDTKTSVTNTLSQITDTNVWIGRSNYGNDELKATVYDVRIYNQALTAGQISESYNAAQANP
jgi:hypothetical protein